MDQASTGDRIGSRPCLWAAAAVILSAQLSLAGSLDSPELDAHASQSAIAALNDYLQSLAEPQIKIDELPATDVPLSKQDAKQARQMLWELRRKWIRRERKAEMDAREVQLDELTMPFAYHVYGEPDPKGRRLYISLHGGGGAPARVNDQQWENQKTLYRPEEGVYLAPRAPTNTWNLWHQPHVDGMIQRLIENLVVFEGVDPDRVYVMGYSAGGDGVYQLAPRIADRFAAASMMAGHPNESRPLGLRNLPFSIHVGGRDTAYDRNTVAEEWGAALDDLQKSDPDGYPHLVKIYPDKGHWMDREDASAVPWMAQFERNPAPQRVVWWQDDVTHDAFYWLSINQEQRQAGALVEAEIDRQTVHLATEQLEHVTIRLDDRLLDLDQPVRVEVDGQVVFEGTLPRTINNLAQTLQQRGDVGLMYSASLDVRLP